MEKYSITNLGDKYRDTLLGFMAAMYEWESSGYEKSLEAFSEDASEIDLEKSMRADLLVIFKKYVVDEGRNYDRVENIVCGRWPEYDLAHDEIDVCIGGGSTASVIIRKKTGLRASFKLTLVMEGGVCKVGRRDLQSDKKWQRTYV
ncbi:NTF2 fold immunity protein [Pseudomonas sp. NPDC089554]|uniref:NTF2 fold immunity protein n=1 Tax=Pseudomonas sp. NPDC089554 TaxID=3390653 RepID=UPI003D03FB04